MATVSKCAANLSKASDGLITKEEAENFIKEMRSRAERSKSTGDTRDLDEVVFAKAKELFEDVSVEAKVRRRNAIKQVIALDRQRTFMVQFKNKFIGLKALLGGDSAAYKGSKNSIDANQKAIKMQFIGGLAGDLEAEGLLPRFNTGELDDQIAEELWNITSVTGKPGSTNVPDAKRMAEIVHTWQRAAVDRQNRSGAWIRDLDGYIVTNSHDMDAIRRSGFEKWLEFVTPRISARTFKGVKPGREREFLEGVFNGLASGIHRKHGTKHFNVSKALATSGNLARSVSQERMLHFKDAGSWSEYNKTFGRKSIRESVFTGLERAAESIGLMEKLGPNPHSNFDVLANEAIDQLQAGVAAGEKGAVKQLKLIQGGFLTALMKEVDGTTRIPVSPGAGRWQSNFRAVQSMSKLGGATLSSLTDLPALSMELQYQGHNFISSWKTALTGMLQGRGDAERREIARHLGVAVDGMIGEVYARFSAEDSLSGRTAGLMHNYFKLNLQNWWNDTFRTSAGMMMSSHLAEKSKLSFNSLDPNLKRVLSLYDIDESNWAVIKKLAQKTSDGNEFVTPNKVRDLTDAEIRGFLNDPNASRNKIESFKDRIETNLRSYFVDRADHAVPTPGANERAYMLRGTQPGDPLGEAARFFWQFKSFPLTFLSRIWGRELSGRVTGAAEAGIPGRLVEGLKHGVGTNAAIAQMMIGTTVFGYLAMATKDIAKGREPRDPLDLKTMTAAFIQGGGAGIFGDFMFGEFNRFGRSALATVAGPSIAEFGSIAELYSAFKQDVTTGEGDSAARAVKLLMNNSGAMAFIPKVGKVSQFANLFYTRLALDHMFLYQLQENMNPGFLKRMQRRMREENDQEFLIPPQ